MKKLYVFCFLLFLHFQLFAQEHSVDLVTGTMSTSIPLFSVQNGDIQVSGDLVYTGSGVKVTDDDGWVGHNWNLSVNSFRITREMRGLPDELLETSGEHRKGWLDVVTGAGEDIKDFPINTDGNSNTCTDEVVNYNFLNGFGFNIDTEPDAFHVAAPGLSFQFFFDENQEIQVVPYQDVLVEKEITDNQIISFTVTDSRGVKYEFKAAESLTEEAESAHDYYFVRKTHMLNNPVTYNASWRLSRIISPVNGEINFLYRKVHTLENDIIPEYFRRSTQYKYRFEEVLNQHQASRTVFKYSRESDIQILDKIITPHREVHFISTRKDENTIFERLNSIEIYELRNGSAEKVKEIGLVHYLANNPDAGVYSKRAFLREVKEISTKGESSSVFKHEMYYDGSFELPNYRSSDKDEWGFYKISPYSSGDKIPYDQTVEAGLLAKITYPEKGFTAFFYEPHDYWDGSTTIQGGGVRIKKAITYDGVSTTGKVKSYEYKTEEGRTSGKFQHKALLKFSAAKMHKITDGGTYYNRRYLEHQIAKGYAADDPNLIKLFTLTSDQELAHAELLHGSAVAYERVVERTQNNGYSVYEFELPASYGEASANDNEWKASEVFIARQPTGNSYCFEKPNIFQGINRYPFPPNPNFDYAKGLLKKESHYNSQDVKVSDVVYDHERVYRNGESVTKIYGISFERQPTYYYNGSTYIDGHMFLYSKYEINTDVKTVIGKKTETVYYSADLSKKNTIITEYHYDSPHHAELTRTVRFNSDGSENLSRLKYVKDYALENVNDEASTALKSLRDAHRNMIVESTSSIVTGGTERFLGGNLTSFNLTGTKVYPHHSYSFISNEGATSFVPSAVESVGGSFRFTFDDKYKLDQTYLSFDDYGNPTEVKNRDRSVKSVIWGYDGTLPALEVENCRLSELKYSDFESEYSTSFQPGYSPTYVDGRAGSKGISMPGGGASNFLRAALTRNDNKQYNFSCWIKSSTSGTLYLEFFIGYVAKTFEIPFQSSADYKYYSINNISLAQHIGNTSTYEVKVKSSAAIQLDDLAFYPSFVNFMAYTYQIPYGKASETDARGNALYYDYDEFGRVTVVYDREGNILKKYEYQVTP
jgi:YD repeat-containing protein